MNDQPRDWTREELEAEYVGHMTVRTVPVNIRIEAKQMILDLSRIRNLLESARHIAVEECECRHRVQGCDGPLDVCLSLNDEATDIVDRGHGQMISLSEALRVLERSHRAGLVHLAYTLEGSEEIDIICSCCPCCCHSLAALVRFGYDGHIIRSDMIASRNDEDCIRCGTCVERCRFGVWEEVNGEVVPDFTKCFGCGVCVSTCQGSAIALTPRS
ncbi:hypothetical protein AMJ39_05510 [candidate division TA06 bacterium DG_24]|uniref:4Fe-4S ferredoxin-type domain-containing protein n=3 Tax=Bacteria division TA06 TaxID=1156500 RepID=A0A0S8JLT3_UNCT6|nr:MAG: hypothetical protein AMJ39_05510 [candidate division TA06 bacterium DG_24]KPK69199.1 MAG: hypothetical protein AMJ82_06205 [candidate division TA06 bacterium SM23_40]KPL10681.1 MAG: hypothetical protein AMJ71_02275 [candidate division TA06 bacterium SM1_40]